MLHWKGSMHMKALVFDACGTLFDVHSVIQACEREFPGEGAALSRTWRAKQVEYTWLRSLMARYEDFWVGNAGLTGVFAHVLSADAVKIYTPSPAVYQLAATRSKLECAAIGFVSSNC